AGLTLVTWGITTRRVFCLASLRCSTVRFVAADSLQREKYRYSVTAVAIERSLAGTVR
ncbi:hypothetical protein HAX54_020184, partial [Datura stramonium]|nr:hypothetical protein [Datura stramonium]